jgi:hypothetical protein
MVMLATALATATAPATMHTCSSRNPDDASLEVVTSSDYFRACIISRASCAVQQVMTLLGLPSCSLAFPAAECGLSDELILGCHMVHAMAIAVASGWLANSVHSVDACSDALGAVYMTLICSDALGAVYMTLISAPCMQQHAL